MPRKKKFKTRKEKGRKSKIKKFKKFKKSKGKDKAKDYFLLADGKKLKTIRELYNALIDMDEEMFSFYVNEEKNDFYRWAKHVCKDKKLANDLFECATREAALFCLKNNLDREKEQEKKYKSISASLPIPLQTTKLKAKPKQLKKEITVGLTKGVTEFRLNRVKTVRAKGVKDIIKNVKGVYQIG